MSDQRDELAAVIASARVEIWGENESEPCEQDYELASEIIASDVFKPRTITTVEELDALPVGSVVASCKVHELPGGHVYPLSYQRLYTGDWHRGGRSGESRPEYILPATVLFTPGADQ